MQPTIGQRIAAVRKRQFIGRQAECDLLRSALTQPSLPFCVLYLHGPGGVGKTSLLQSFAELCTELHIRHFALDARNIEPAPPAFVSALREALGLDTTNDPISFLSTVTEPLILLLDTFELLEEMNPWFRETLLPQISTHVLFIVAGRQLPAAAWSLDSSWDSVFRALRLHNFNASESAAYLQQRQVPPDRHPAAIAFTHGHPLALSLLADLYRTLPDAEVALRADATSPDVVDTLLKRFMLETPGGLQKSALEVCAVVRGTNEALLRELLFPSDTIPDADSLRTSATTNDEITVLFAWLRTLSFIDSGPFGLFPHDITREALLADLRWRDPEWFVELHRRARRYYIQQLQQSSGEETQKRFLYDAVFLHRDSETVRAAFTWNEAPTVYADRLRESDIAYLQKMVTLYEGKAAADTAYYWFTQQPGATVVFRSRSDGENENPVAFFTMISLHQMTPADYAADPAALAIGNYITKAGPLRENEGAACLRFWMARDTYQAPSPLQSLLIVHALRHFLTRGQRLAYTFFCCQNPQNWQALFDYAEIPLVTNYIFDKHKGGIFGRDWRRIPLANWLETIAEKETGAVSGPVVQRAAEKTSDSIHTSLTQPQFASAVQAALRHLHHLDKLRHSSLLRSHLFLSSGSPVGLQKLLQETIEQVNRPDKQAQRGYLALRHTYLTPALTQEDAAERLDLPFSTYRRHLAEGIASVTTILWEKEISGSER